MSINVLKMELVDDQGERIEFAPVWDARQLNRIAEEEQWRRDAGLPPSESLACADATFFVRVDDALATFPLEARLEGLDDAGSVLQSVDVWVPGRNQTNDTPILAYHGELTSEARSILEEYFVLVDPVTRIRVSLRGARPGTYVCYDATGTRVPSAKVVFTDEKEKFEVHLAKALSYVADIAVTLDTAGLATVAVKKLQAGRWEVEVTGNTDGVTPLHIRSDKGTHLADVELVVTSRVLLCREKTGSWNLAERRAQMANESGLCGANGLLKPGTTIKSFRFLDPDSYFTALYSMAYEPHELYIMTHGNTTSHRLEYRPKEDVPRQELVDDTPWVGSPPGTDDLAKLQRKVRGRLYPKKLNTRSVIKYYACYSSIDEGPGANTNGPARKTEEATSARCLGYPGLYTHEVYATQPDGTLAVDDQTAFQQWLQAEQAKDPGLTQDQAIQNVLTDIFCSDANWNALNDANKAKPGWGWKFTLIRYVVAQGPIKEVE